MSDRRPVISRRTVIKLVGVGGLAASLGAMAPRAKIVSAAGPALGVVPEIPGVRLVDTRTEGASGRLAAGVPRGFGPFTQLPLAAQALYGTVTALDWNAPGWLIVYNFGGQVPGELPGTMVANLAFGGPAPAASGAFLVGDTQRPVGNPTGQSFSVVIWPLRDHGPSPTCHVVVDVFGSLLPPP